MSSISHENCKVLASWKERLEEKKAKRCRIGAFEGNATLSVLLVRAQQIPLRHISRMPAKIWKVIQSARTWCRFATFCQFEKIIVGAGQIPIRHVSRGTEKYGKLLVSTALPCADLLYSANSRKPLWGAGQILIRQISKEQNFTVIWKAFQPAKPNFEFIIFCQFEKNILWNEFEIIVYKLDSLQSVVWNTFATFCNLHSYTLLREKTRTK